MSTLEKNIARIKELTAEIDSLRQAARDEWQRQNADIQQLLFPEAAEQRRVSRHAKAERQPRSVESRFNVSLSRILNHSDGMDKDTLTAKLNDAAARVAEKNGIDVPQAIWQLIDTHLQQKFPAVAVVIAEAAKPKARARK